MFCYLIIQIIITFIAESVVRSFLIESIYECITCFTPNQLRQDMMDAIYKDVLIKMLEQTTDPMDYI